MAAIGANSLCPCGSGAKYKRCCRDRVDWESLVRRPLSDDAIHHLHVRGRNLLFLEQVRAELGVDDPISDWHQVKRAATAQRIGAIARAAVDVWPPSTKLSSALSRSAGSTIALHIGTQQEPWQIARQIARHALYAEKILIFDPIVYPLAVKEEYSALAHPEQHIFNTLKHLRTWFVLEPWIASGLVEIIRGPSDFQPNLRARLHRQAKDLYEGSPLLKEALETDIERLMDGPESSDLKSLHVFGKTDRSLHELYLQFDPSASVSELDKFVAHVRKLETDHPYFTNEAIRQGGQVTTTTSGASYAEGAMVAEIVNAYLVTDLKARWLEIKMDRQGQSSPARQWDPFSKAFSEAKISSFDNVPLEFALRMRAEDRLGDMRSFLRTLWHSIHIEDFDPREAELLADRFRDELTKAEFEWKKINLDLMKWVGAESMVAAAVAAFGGELLPAVGWGVAAAAQVANSTLTRAGFRRRYPAALFLELHNRKL